MHKNLKNPNFAAMTKAEKTAALAEAYTEGAAEFAELARKLAIPARMCREMGMPEAEIWAAIVLANAEALELDLDKAGGMAAAAIISYYQMQG